MHKPTLLLTLLTVLTVTIHPVTTREIYFPRIDISATFYRRALSDDGSGSGTGAGAGTETAPSAGPEPDENANNPSYLANKHGSGYQPSYGVWTSGLGAGVGVGVGGAGGGVNEQGGGGEQQGGEPNPNPNPNHWQRIGHKLVDVAHIKNLARSAGKKIHARAAASDEGVADVVSEPTPVGGVGSGDDQVVGETTNGDDAYTNEHGEAAIQFPVLKEILDGVERVVGQQ